MEVLRETNFDFLGVYRKGKVRDVYEQEDRLILISTDRHSSFDRIIAHIPWKGQVLNQISAWWFEQIKDIVSNHVLAVPDPNVTVGKKYKTVSIEAVVRGYLTGVTDTAIWTRYSAGQRSFDVAALPDGMKKNQKLPNPIFDPTTKEDGHDRTLSKKELLTQGFVTEKLFNNVRTMALTLFARGQAVAEQRGLILVDTKYEFGITEAGELVLIDEIHTPDSSRYWQLSTYEDRFKAQEEPEYFDKEFLRLWFRDHCDPYKDAVLPEAPTELVEEMSRRYIQMYEQITGKPFIKGETPVLTRIEKNLKQYAV